MKWNAVSQLEGMDRCHTILVMLDELLSHHPAVKRAKGRKKYRKAERAVVDLYQMIGALDEEDKP